MEESHAGAEGQGGRGGAQRQRGKGKRRSDDAGLASHLEEEEEEGEARRWREVQFSVFCQPHAQQQAKTPISYVETRLFCHTLTGYIFSSSMRSGAVTVRVHCCGLNVYSSWSQTAGLLLKNGLLFVLGAPQLFPPLHPFVRPLGAHSSRISNFNRRDFARSFYLCRGWAGRGWGRGWGCF